MYESCDFIDRWIDNWPPLDTISLPSRQFLFNIVGVIAARDASLTFMVGGSEEQFEQAENVLKNIGKNVLHCGTVGTGQVCCKFSVFHFWFPDSFIEAVFPLYTLHLFHSLIQTGTIC